MTDQIINCAICAKPLPADANFCPNCGASASLSRFSTSNKPTTTPMANEAPVKKPVDGRSATAARQSTSSSGPVIKPGLSRNIKVMATVFIVIIIAANIAPAVISSGVIDKLNDKMDSADQSNGESTSPSPAPKASTGSTDCYRVTLHSGSEASETSKCNLRIRYGERQLDTAYVQDIIGKETSLQNHVARWKRINSPNATVVSETPAKSGSYDAVKIVFKYNTSERNRVIWLIYTGGKHDLGNYRPDGFEVTGTYATPQQQQALDGLFSTIQWK